MPELDGFALTKILKSDPRTKDIPIFGLDNLGQEADIQAAKEVGMVDYWVSAKHMPNEVVEHVCELLHLPKPTFDHPIDTPQQPKKSWWKKLFS